MSWRCVGNMGDPIALAIIEAPTVDLGHLLCRCCPLGLQLPGGSEEVPKDSEYNTV